MRRLNDYRNKSSGIQKHTRLDVNTEQSTKFKMLNNDLLYILQTYDGRIKFVKNETGHSYYIKCHVTELVYENIYKSNIWFELYRNLKTVVLQNMSFLNLDMFCNTKHKQLKIKSCGKIVITQKLVIEEIVIKNMSIQIDVLNRLLGADNLKSCKLINVHISNTQKSDYIEDEDVISDSDEYVKEYDLESDNENENAVYDTNVSIRCILQKICLKQLTIINTNINIETDIPQSALASINIFKYRLGTRSMFYSYSSLYTFYKGNYYKNMNFQDIESVTVHKTELFYKAHSLQNLKHISVKNCKIDDGFVYEIHRKCNKIVEFEFIGCTFGKLSFYKFVKAFSHNLAYLNITNSTVPIDSLDYLYEHVNNCKVVFRDRSVYRLP